VNDTILKPGAEFESADGVIYHVEDVIDFDTLECYKGECPSLVRGLLSGIHLLSPLLWQDVDYNLVWAEKGPVLIDDVVPIKPAWTVPSTAWVKPFGNRLRHGNCPFRP